MSELNGQVLGLLLVVAVFAAMVPTLITLFNNMVDSVEDEVNSLYVIGEDGKSHFDTSSTETKAYITSDLLSF